MGIEKGPYKASKIRTRTSFGSSELPLTSWAQTHLGLGQVPSDTSGTDTTSGLLGMRQGVDRSMTDLVVDRFHERSKHGEILNNPMSSWMVEYLPSFGTMVHKATFVSPTSVPECVRTHSGYLGAGFGSSGSNPGIFSPEMILPLKTGALDRLISLAAVNAYSRVVQPETQALVSLAEAHKSIALVSQTARKLANAAIALKRGNIDAAQRAIGRKYPISPVKEIRRRLTLEDKLAHSRKGRNSRSKALDTFSNTWLEHRYGWGPLMMEISGTLQALAKGEFQQPPRQTARGFRTHTEEQEWTDSNYYKPVQTNHQGAYRFKYLQKDTVSVRAFVLYTVAGNLQRIHDFGFTSFPSAAWELIPFSFVVDWFAPVGDWISGLEPKLGVLQLASGYTVTRETVLSRTIDAYQNPPDTDGHNYRPLVSAIGHTDTIRMVRKDRVVPLPYPTLPPIDVKINVTRATDALALLRNVSRSVLRT